MKKVLSVMAVSAFVLTAGVAFAGGPGKKAADCPAACQQQIDDLNSSQAQQNEQLGAHGKQLKNHEGRITALEKAFQDYWYVRLGAGAAWMSADLEGYYGVDRDTDLDTGYLGQVAFGRDFAMYNAPGRFRAELAFSFQSSDIGDDNLNSLATYGYRLQDASVDVYTFMANGYYELPVADAFSVYAMAGIGLAYVELDGSYSEISTGGWTDIDQDGNSAFAYKVGLGVTYNFTPEIAGDLGYEYLGIADVGDFKDIGGSNVVASVRFKF